jgi:branched-subunit amino acid transport protein
MYALRAAVPLATSNRELPDRVVTITSFVAPAVIGALLAGSLAASASNSTELSSRVLVLAVGFATALRTRSIPLTIAAGLGTHLLLATLI